MSILLLKLILTPLLIGIASLAGRRWGPQVSGWLIGLPFTSAPVTFFLALPLPLLYVTVLVSLVVALFLLPRVSAPAASDAEPLPHWDIPARMIVATAFVVLLTGIAPALGPRLSGLLAPFPLYASILT